MWESLFLLFFSVCVDSKMNVLIFGGNGFIGGETAKLLLDEGHQLTVVNRGRNWPWDTAETIRPFVNHIKCDRYKPEKESWEIWKVLDNPDVRFDAVIDFSAFRPSSVTPFYDALKEKADRYIYISSDSVYEVCEHIVADRPLRETDSIRPKEEEIRKELNSKDTYGNGKLEVEEFLINRRASGGVPYVFLRLPDVLGPRDTTDRYWKYHMYLKYNKELGKLIPIPSFTEKLRTSYVYVKDVARAISKILADKSISDKVYNLAFKEPKNLEQLLRAMGAASFGFDEEQMSEKIASGDGEWYFPSVTRGSIDTEKAEKELDFVPTEWDTALKEISEFYEDALWRFPEERDETCKYLLKELGLKEDQERKNAFLDAVLADAAKRRKIEL